MICGWLNFATFRVGGFEVAFIPVFHDDFQVSLPADTTTRFNLPGKRSAGFRSPRSQVYMFTVNEVNHLIMESSL